MLSLEVCLFIVVWYENIMFGKLWGFYKYTIVYDNTSWFFERTYICRIRKKRDITESHLRVVIKLLHWSRIASNRVGATTTTDNTATRNKKTRTTTLTSINNYNNSNNNS